MNKIIPILLLASISTSSLFISSPSTAATPGVNLLQNNVVESFLQKANNPKTALHKQLVELNQADGRNSNGIFPKILTVKNIQIVTIGGTDQFGTYCSMMQNKPEHLQCSNEISETYLILIPSKMGVHKAVEYQKFQFLVQASKKFNWKKDEKEKEYDRQESITISEPKQIYIEKLLPTI